MDRADPKLLTDPQPPVRLADHEEVYVAPVSDEEADRLTVWAMWCEAANPEARA